MGKIMWRDIEWAPQLEEDDIVWISVKKFDAVSSLEKDFYIKNPPDPEDQVKYQRFGAWFSKSHEAIVMPHISLFAEGFSFSNGRNRFAWLRDQGLKSLPVTAHPEESLELRRLVGTKSRESRIRIKI